MNFDYIQERLVVMSKDGIRPIEAWEIYEYLVLLIHIRSENLPLLVEFLSLSSVDHTTMHKSSYFYELCYG